MLSDGKTRQCRRERRKIRQWYSRGDGKDVVLLLDVKTEDEARAIVETLPLVKEQLMDHEDILAGPLIAAEGI